MTEKQLSNQLYEIECIAKAQKWTYNRLKIEFGIILLELEKLCSLGQIKGYDTDTFNQMLAGMHLNKRRVFSIMKNAEYALKYLDTKNYDRYDSSVLELLRKNNKNPNDYLDDICAGISYSDLKAILYNQNG